MAPAQLQRGDKQQNLRYRTRGEGAETLAVAVFEGGAVEKFDLGSSDAKGIHRLPFTWTGQQVSHRAPECSAGDNGTTMRRAQSEQPSVPHTLWTNFFTLHVGGKQRETKGCLRETCMRSLDAPQGHKTGSLTCSYNIWTQTGPL